MTQPLTTGELVAALGKAKVALFDGEEVDWIAASAAIDAAIVRLEALTTLERELEDARTSGRDAHSMEVAEFQAEVERLKALVTDMTKAARTLELAEEELHRAEATAEQPRLMDAGTRYYAAKQKVFSVAFRARASLEVEERKT